MLRPSIFSSATYATLAVSGRGFAHPFVERLQLVIVVCVVETEHRREVLNGLEAGYGPSCDALRRRIGGDEVRVIRFELLELVKQAVELFVGDFGVAEDVIPLLVMADCVSQLANAFLRRCRRHHPWQV